MFYLAAGALVVLALAFAARPLLMTGRKPRRAGQSGGETREGRRAAMRALYRDRVAELESEAAAGQLDQEIRAQVLDELGANLLEEYTSAEAAPAVDAGGSGPARPGIVFWLVLILLPVAAIGVYLSAGEPDALTLAGATEVLGLDPRDDQERIETWRTRLSARVERHPEDGQSWYLLGVSRLQLGEFAAAADAFAEAHEHLGSDPTVDVYWLQARYLAAGGAMDERSQALARQILEARPNHPLVLEMLAIEAYRHAEYRTAVELLNRALNNPLPPAQQRALMGGLEEARSRMGSLSPTIDVNVELPPEGPRQGTLFVIARPPGGGMPYAVVRRPAALLPMSVRLDDTVSMSGLELSSAEEIEVVARLSASGSPTAGPGDWEWRSDVLRPGERREPLSLDATLRPRGAGES